MKHSKIRRQHEYGRRLHEFNPSFEDFRRFLEQNLYRRFVMNDPWSCVGAVYCGKELPETFVGPAWFQELQRKTHLGVWLGKDLLVELKRLKSPTTSLATTPRAHNEQTLEHGSLPRQAQRRQRLKGKKARRALVG
jgi:hypothetical protein